MGKRKNYAEDEDEIREKIRKLETQLQNKSRRRIRVLESSSSEAEDDTTNHVTDQTGPGRTNNVPNTPHTSPPSQQSPYYHDSPRRGPSSEPPWSPAQPHQEMPRPASPQPGPSSAPHLVLGDTAEEILPSSEDVELDEEILKLLGDAPKPDLALGKSIHKDVASRWKEILMKGLQKEVKEKILEEYLVPSNCELFIAPALNPEAKAALPDYLVKRDASLMHRQKQLGSALAALARATDLIITQNSSPQDILKPISDACRILCDSHFLETKTRRNFVISAINTKLKDALINTERDKFLFGDNVSDKVKAVQNQVTH
ncbi:hypothetical protein MSG28_015533 [Choristoneura fumiferana]|uniref:Uncharacterized protein n=1 Tax=Choristoneura fumiferana TaxID=7141 RepID=A0ACC0KBS0_CHOFU|nr:hypothetical protein MSG28_015533 [Choristoneura fumiferana]